jgi:hypothetical protein
MARGLRSNEVYLQILELEMVLGSETWEKTWEKRGKKSGKKRGEVLLPFR